MFSYTFGPLWKFWKFVFCTYSIHCPSIVISEAPSSAQASLTQLTLGFEMSMMRRPGAVKLMTLLLSGFALRNATNISSPRSPFLITWKTLPNSGMPASGDQLPQVQVKARECLPGIVYRSGREFVPYARPSRCTKTRLTSASIRTAAMRAASVWTRCWTPTGSNWRIIDS